MNLLRSRATAVLATMLTGTVLTAAGWAGTSLGTAGPATAAVPEGSLTPDYTFDLNLGNAGSGYTLAPDNTFWTFNGRVVAHEDDHGNRLSGGFTAATTGNSAFLGIAATSNRLFFSDYSNGPTVLRSFDFTGTPQATSDAGTTGRVGDNQAGLRASGDSLLVTMGQSNKIATLTVDPSDFSQHPYYPQAWMGVGINHPDGTSSAWEQCVIIGGTPENGVPDEQCARGGGKPGPLDYPSDIAVIPGGGLLVSNYGGNDVQAINADGTPGQSFSGVGTGAGQLRGPDSIVRDGDHVYVAEQTNNRISEFTTGGAFIAAYGYGVLVGADPNAWESCGPGTGDCQAGSGGAGEFERLDVGNGHLYVQAALSGQGGHMLALAIDGTASTATPTPPATPIPTTPSPNATPAPTPAPDSVTLTAARNRVQAGGRTSLTATVGPAASCGLRSVQLQRDKGGSWRSSGRLVAVGPGCTAELRSPRVHHPTRLRVADVSASGSVLATSGTVALTPKARRHHRHP